MRLGVLWALFIASGKMFIRNRAAVFFSLFLPLIIMLIFGVLNFEGRTEIALGVVDEADNEASGTLRDRLAEYEYFTLIEGDRAGELAELEEGDRDYVLVIPEGWSVPAPFAPGGGGGSGGFAAPLSFESVESRDLGYIDFLVPGIVGMTIMQLGLFGVAFGFVQLKRTGALRRLFATPTSPAYFLSAQVASRLVLGYVQVVILVGIGIWFGLQMFGSWLVLAVIIGLALLIFLAVRFRVAGWA